MTGPTLPDGLWTQVRDGQGLKDLYDGWADRYDADMAAGGMLGPRRLVDMLVRLRPDRGTTLLDFGCGTGAVGEVLAETGYGSVHGVDISEGMLAIARDRGVYATLDRTEPDAPVTIPPGTGAVLCSGSICIGAGPASLLGQVARAMEPGAILLLTYNDDTLRDHGYMSALADVQIDGILRLDLAEYGPQLPALGRGATAYALRRL